MPQLVPVDNDPFASALTPTQSTMTAPTPQMGGFSGAGQIPLHGDEYLKQLSSQGAPPEVIDSIKKIATYQIDPRVTYSNRTYGSGGGPSQREKFIQWAMEYDPEYDQAQIGPRFNTTKSFAPGGNDYKNATAFNTLVQHVSDLHQLGQGLGNIQTVPASNIIKNAYKSGVEGWDLPTNFKTYAEAVATEAISVLKRAGVPADAEIKRIISNIDPNASPTQIQGQVDSLLNIVTDRMGVLANNWRSTMGPNKPLPNALVDPAVQAKLDFIEKNKVGGNWQPDIPSAAQRLRGFTGAKSQEPVRVTDPSDIERLKLPSGTPLILPDGTPGRVP